MFQRSTASRAEVSVAMRHRARVQVCRIERPSEASDDAPRVSVRESFKHSSSHALRSNHVPRDDWDGIDDGSRAVYLSLDSSSSRRN